MNSQEQNGITSKGGKKGINPTKAKREKPQRKVFYYSDEKEDFLKQSKAPPRIDGDYVYLKKSRGFSVLRFVLYRLIATPVAFLYTKLRFGERYVGRKKLVAYLKLAKRKKTAGAFLFGNHTQPVADAFTPNVICFPFANYVIINPDNMNIPIVGKALGYLGGLPTPGGLAAGRNFSRAIRDIISEGKTVTVYPEGHLWPFYTGLRCFDKSSIGIAVTVGAPIFTFTRVYKKRRVGIGCTVYIDGPFYPSASLSGAAARLELEGRIFEKMKERCSLSEDTGYGYIKREDDCEGDSDKDTDS